MSFVWTEPAHDRPSVDRAGQILRSVDASNEEELILAFDVLENWRAAHAFPLNTFQVVLRRRAHEVDSEALVAQRLKRVPSILKKLEDRPSMRLAQMQDIGGCWAVLRTVRMAQRLRDNYLRRSSTSTLVTTKDYIAEPRESGYRSLHLVFRYHSRAEQSAFNGLLIEIQIRSQLQHAWATAVETVGLLSNQALKSSEGSASWLRFFLVTSSLFALKERTQLVPGTPVGSTLVREVREEAQRLRVAEKLNTYRQALRVLGSRRVRHARYFLMRLDPDAEALEIASFRDGELTEAVDRYAEIEKEVKRGSSVDVVLVRADSIESLQRAYPNYFLDTQVFLETLAELTPAPIRPKAVAARRQDRRRR
jgi:hypothetical protein